MTDSIASETRAAVRERPYLLRALRAGVVNYRAAAEQLGLDADPDSVATALRRYAAELDPTDGERRAATVRMQSGVDLAEPGADVDTDPDDLVLAVGDARVVRGGELTAVRAEGEVDTAALSAALERLATASVLVDAAGVVDDELVVVVPRRQGATALRLVEQTLAAVPT